MSNNGERYSEIKEPKINANGFEPDIDNFIHLMNLENEYLIVAVNFKTFRSHASNQQSIILISNYFRILCGQRTIGDRSNNLSTYDHEISTDKSPTLLSNETIDMIVDFYKEMIVKTNSSIYSLGYNKLVKEEYATRFNSIKNFNKMIGDKYLKYDAKVDKIYSNNQAICKIPSNKNKNTNSTEQHDSYNEYQKNIDQLSDKLKSGISRCDLVNELLLLTNRILQNTSKD